MEPTLSPMQLNPRHLVMQFAHTLQEELFPRLQTAGEVLSGPLQLLSAVMLLAPLG
jgi:hypothetical protein